MVLTTTTSKWAPGSDARRCLQLLTKSHAILRAPKRAMRLKTSPPTPNALMPATSRKAGADAPKSTLKFKRAYWGLEFRGFTIAVSTRVTQSFCGPLAP